MKVTKTMVEEINVQGMNAEDVLLRISTTLQDMKSTCGGLDHVSFMKMETFSEEVPNECTCGATNHIGIHGGQCKATTVKQIPHVRIIVKVTADAKEAGKE